jgi:hypothetical protein
MGQKWDKVNPLSEELQAMLQLGVDYESFHKLRLSIISLSAAVPAPDPKHCAGTRPAFMSPGDAPKRTPVAPQPDANVAVQGLLTQYAKRLGQQMQLQREALDADNLASDYENITRATEKVSSAASILAPAAASTAMKPFGSISGMKETACPTVGPPAAKNTTPIEPGSPQEPAPEANKRGRSATIYQLLNDVDPTSAEDDAPKISTTRDDKEFPRSYTAYPHRMMDLATPKKPSTGPTMPTALAPSHGEGALAANKPSTAPPSHDPTHNPAPSHKPGPDHKPAPDNNPAPSHKPAAAPPVASTAPGKQQPRDAVVPSKRSKPSTVKYCSAHAV